MDNSPFPIIYSWSLSVYVYKISGLCLCSLIVWIESCIPKPPIFGTEKRRKTFQILLCEVRGKRFHLHTQDEMYYFV